MLLALDGLEPDNGCGREEDLRQRLCEVLQLLVPAAAFEEEAVRVNAVARSIAVRVLRHHLEIKLDLVDRDGVLARVVLSRTCQESLREKETRDPEHRRWLLLEPPVECLDALEEVCDV